jgi:hypothetical protein
MSIQMLGDTVTEAVDNDLNAARSKFGAAFEHAVSAIFELLQLNETIALLAARSESAGIGALEISKMAAVTIGSVCSHALEMLPKGQQAEAMAMAKRLMEHRAVLARAATADRSKGH